MLVSHKWICEIAGISPSPKDLADRFTFSGLEVEELRQVGADLNGVVVGEIKERKAHPSRPDLYVVKVDTGGELRQMVCGAPNTPESGGRVAAVLPGSVLKGLVIEPRKLAGVQSEGMLVSEMEIDIGPDRDGILILDDDIEAPAGTPLEKALNLTDWIIEISVTPNRPDALGHYGLAREAALLFGKPFKPALPSPAPESDMSAEEIASVDLIDSVACPRYAAAILSGLKIKRSPFDIRYRLHTLGIRPISNVVDVTNLMLIEFGQPLHAFDLKRLAGPKIIVRKAKDGERMITLDEVERVFCSDDLLICDAKRPVAVAGVMGGMETGVSNDTTEVLLECAYFQPAGIRRTSRRLKLSSESSYRFERGVDPNLTLTVLSAAASLSTRLAGGAKARGTIDRYPKPIEPKRVAMRRSRFERLMGYQVEPDEMRRILIGLGAEVRGDDERLEVAVPTSRPDIEREVDLVEEVARIRGLGEMPSTMPRIRSTRPRRSEFEAMRKAKEILSALGLDEAICYSFVQDDMLRAFGASDGLVRIANPLNAERAAMRTTLLVGLVENLKRAMTRFLPGTSQFEVGKTFHDEGQELPREVLRAAVVLSGPADRWIGEEPRSYDFYDAKGVAEAFVSEYSGCDPMLVATGEIRCMHPCRACRIEVEGKPIGAVGEIHPSILAALKLPVGACAIEMELETLWKLRKTPAVAKLLDYPPVTRDVALLVGEEQDSGPLAAALAIECGPLARKVALFDLYRGEGIPDGKKSIAFSVTYQAADRTLTDEEVDAIHRAAIDRVSGKFGAKVR